MSLTQRIPAVWLKRAQAVVVGLIVGSIITAVLRLWGPISQIHWKFDIRYLLLSIGLVVVTIIGWAWVWAWMVRSLNPNPIALRQLASIYIYSNVAKYVPGSVWNYVARAHLGRQQDISQRQIWVANFVEVVTALFTGLTLYGVSLLWPHRHQPMLPTWMILLAALILCLSVSPIGLDILLRIITVFQRKGDVEQSPVRVQGEYIFVYLIMSLIIWVIISFAFFMLIQSLYPLPFQHLTEVTGAYSFSFVAGLLAVGLPQGLGVREGILVVVLSSLVPLPLSFSIAIMTRFWLVMCDLLSVILWWYFEKYIISAFILRSTTL